MSNIVQNTTDLQAVLDAVNALPEKVNTSGTATAADIYVGKTATVNDQKITGTNPWNDANVKPYVDEALAALTEKGVDSSGKGLADLAALIAAIEAGGGGSELSIEMQTVTPSSDVKEISVPAINTAEIKIVIVKHQNTFASNDNELFASVYFLNSGTLYYLSSYSYKSGAAAFIIGNNVKTGFETLPRDRYQIVENETAPVVRIDNNNVYFGSPNGAKAFAGVTYTFYIGRY